MTIEEGVAAGRASIKRAAQRANRENPGWSAQALAAVRHYVRGLSRRAEFHIEDIRNALGAEVPEPSDLRAWGGVTQAAIRLDIIKRTGDYKRAASSHGSPKMLYVRGKFA